MASKQQTRYKSIKEVNDEVVKKIHTLTNCSVKQLATSAQKISEKAKLLRNTEEEEAYYLYMLYFGIIKEIRASNEYKKNKQFFDKLIGWDPNNITITDSLYNNLKERYDLLEKSLNAEVKKAAECKISEDVDKIQRMINEAPDPPDDEDETMSTVDTEKNVIKNSQVANSDKLANHEPELIESKEDMNGLSNCESFISCFELNEALKRKDDILILDIRSTWQFDLSHLNIPGVINIPADQLKNGMTAEALSKYCNDFKLRLLWKNRGTKKIIVLYDQDAEKFPLPKPLMIVHDALLKWDPNTNYMGRVVVLNGGYDMWHLSYPMSTSNPQAQASKIDNLWVRSEDDIECAELNFSYPKLTDAENGFVSSSSQVFTASGNSSISSPTAVNLPSFNRGLKPSTGPTPLDPASSDPTLNSPAAMKVKNEPSVPSPIVTKNGWMDNSEKLETENSMRRVPSRDLKPKELLDSLKGREDSLKLEQSMLEETLLVEKHHIAKLKEIENLRNEAANMDNNDKKIFYEQKDSEKLAEIEILNRKHEALRGDYEILQKKNEELWQIVNNFMKLKISEDKQKDEQKHFHQEEEKKEQLKKEVEIIRAIRKEKERQMERVKKEREEKARAQRELVKHNMENIAESPATPKKTLLRRPLNDSSNKSESFSPSTNLRRSHSSVDLASVGKTDGDINYLGDPFKGYTPVQPGFDRNLKPSTPSRVDAARPRDMEVMYSHKRNVRPGLRNLGNTCYMNATVQCLKHTQKLVNYFFSAQFDNDVNEQSKQGGRIARELCLAIRAMWDRSVKSLSIRPFRDKVGEYYNPFGTSNQQDAHEFLIKILDWLQDDLNRVRVTRMPEVENDDAMSPDYIAGNRFLAECRRRNDSQIFDMFGGVNVSIVTCQKCRKPSRKFETFSVLTLFFPENSRSNIPHYLDTMLKQYYCEDRVEFKCDKCKQVAQSSRCTKMWKSPPVLIIHLNRFEQQDVWMQKKSNLVKFGLNLDIKVHVALEESNSAPPTDNTSLNSCRITSYRLFGVTNHTGTMDGGHYYAYCRTPGSDTWFEFNDLEVYELNSKQNVITPNAYILFYEAANTS